jgi:hypothetical protein
MKSVVYPDKTGNDTGGDCGYIPAAYPVVPEYLNHTTPVWNLTGHEFFSPGMDKKNR